MHQHTQQARRVTANALTTLPATFEPSPVRTTSTSQGTGWDLPARGNPTPACVRLLGGLLATGCAVLALHAPAALLAPITGG